MPNFNFPETGLGLVSLPYFVYDFSRKIFSCYILSTDQISLSDCVYFWRYLAICVLQFFVNQAVTFCCITKTRQKFKYLENEKSF